MTRWKWDSDQRDPLARFRIPSTSPWPLFPYIAAFDRGSAHRPTKREVTALASFIDERKQNCFTSEERWQMDSHPFDICPGASTVVFRKYARNDWGYRRARWPNDTCVPPSPRVSTRLPGPMTLIEVMDLINQNNDGSYQVRWQRWKAARPEVFG